MHVKGWIYKHTHTHTHTWHTPWNSHKNSVGLIQWKAHNEVLPVMHSMQSAVCPTEHLLFLLNSWKSPQMCVCIHTWASLCAYTDTNGLGVLCRAGVLFLLFSCSVVSDFVTLRTAAHQASLPFSSFGVCSNSHPLSWWCHQIPTFLLIVVPGSHLILCCLFTDDKEESDSWAYNNTNPIVILM